MGILNKINKWNSKFPDWIYGFIVGFIILGGIVLLFINPFAFFSSNLSYLGYASIPLAIIVLLGWTLLIYSILNTKNWETISKGDSWLKKLKIRKILSLKNSIFIYLTVIFFSLITIIFITFKPYLIIKEHQNKQQIQIDNLGNKIEELGKTINNQIKITKIDTIQ